jgi:excisionase family DNA binding protein
MLTRSEVAKRLSVAVKIVDQLVREGKLQVVRIGKVQRIRESTLVAYIDAAEEWSKQP